MSLPKDEQQKILDTELLVYECEGTEKEIKEWFQTINIAGVPLNKQELLNAIYSGPFITKAKAEYQQLEQRQHAEVAVLRQGRPQAPGDPRGGTGLGLVIHRVAVDAYLAQHRQDKDITGLKTYFTSVIDWVGSVFTRPPDKEMRGLEWGRLYEAYHSTAYNAAEIDKAVNELRADRGRQECQGHLRVPARWGEAAPAAGDPPVRR